MKTNIILIICAVFLPFLAMTQEKEVKGVPLTEESKLTISAKAETLSNVTFSIAPTETVSDDKNKVGFEFPITLEINPLNQKTFRDNFLKSLKEIALYQMDTELLLIDLKKVKNDKQKNAEPTNETRDNLNQGDADPETDTKDKLHSLSIVLNKLLTNEQKKNLLEDANTNDDIKRKLGELKDRALEDLQKAMTAIADERVKEILDTDTFEDFNNLLTRPNTIEYFESKQRIEGLLNRIYRFFDAQLVLLFQFDTEPVAGNLYFNKLIRGVQYYTGDSDELYLKKRVTDYHKLIRQLRKVQKKYNEFKLPNKNQIKIGKDDSKATNELNNPVKEELGKEVSHLTLHDYPKLWKKCLKCDLGSLETIDIEEYLINRGLRTDSIDRDLDDRVAVLKNKIEKLYQKKQHKIEIETNEWGFSEYVMLEHELKFLKDLKKLILVQNNEIQVSQLIPWRLIDSYFLVKDKLADWEDKKKSSRLEYLNDGLVSVEKYIKEKNSLELFFSENINSVEGKRESIVESILKNQTKQLLSRIQNNPLLIYYACVIKSHFANRKEYKIKYLNNPVSFYDNFDDIINRYDVYTWKKREKLIKRRLLELKSIQVLPSLTENLKDYVGAEETKAKLSSTIKFLETQLVIYDRIEKFTSEKTIRLNSKEDQLDELWGKLNDEYQDLTGQDDWDSFSSLKKELSDFEKYYNGDRSRHRENLALSEKYEKLIADYREEWQDIRNLKGENFENEIKKLKNLRGNLFDQTVLDKDILKVLRRDYYDTISNKILRDFYRTNEYGNFRQRLTDSIKATKNSLQNDSKQKNTLQRIRQELDRVTLWDFEAKSIDLDFNDGFLERVVVEAEIKGPTAVNEQSEEVYLKLADLIAENKEWDTHFGKKNKFTSQFPYGFSSQIDYEDIKGYELSVIKGRKKQFSMEMEDVFPEYLQRLANDRLDFSPKNQSVKIDINSEHKETNNKLQLKKEVSSKLFNIKVFTDFIGFGSDPNGAAQFEFDRIIPLHTKRKPVGPRRFLRRVLGPSFNWGYVNYMRPEFRWARLNTSEDTDNLVASTLPTFINGSEQTVSYVTLLDLLRYENISVGADLNLFMFDFPNSKFRTEINAGARFGRTRVLANTVASDTMDEGEPIDSNGFTNTWRYYPEILFRLRPEERYGASLSGRYMRFNTQTRDFSVISSEEQFRENLTDDPQWLWQFAIDAHYSPSATSDNKFFFRYRYSNNGSFETNGFSELQLGYIISLRPRARDRQ
ncbi:MAG: hypothetical protein AAGF96_21560 [Bacteroidota bacterium]